MKTQKGDTIRVMVVDDHPVVREGLAALLDSSDEVLVVADAANGREALKLMRRHRPEVILMDLRMPVMDGLEAMRRIRVDAPNVQIIVLTTFDGEEDIYQAMRAGARAYLLKDAGRARLLEVIKTVHGGQTYLPPAMAQKLAMRVGNVELTPAEQKVLNLMVLGRRNREIAASLGVTEGTVKSHVNSVFSKFGVNSRTAAVATALTRGLSRLE